MLPIFLFPISAVLSQSYTFPLGVAQPYPQYNNAFESRYPYIPGQQMGNQITSPMGQMNAVPMFQQQFQQPRDGFQMQNPQRFSFNPMARIQVQPAMQDLSSPRITSPLGPSEYQVDQRIPSQVPSPSSLTPSSSSSTSSSSSGVVRIVPPFLQSASAADQDRFYEIVQNPSWSGIEKNRRIEEFIKTMSDERQSMYSDFRRDVIDKEAEEKRRNVDRAVSTMSKEAVEQFQNVVRIMHDPSQPESERLKQIEQIYSRLPDAIRKEFDVKLKGF